ncbi:MAG: VWA domain-containing protein [Candidatus Sulfotelmatobacter sp.]
MFSRLVSSLFLALSLLGSLFCTATAQVLHFPAPGDAMQTSMSIDAIQSAQMDFNLFTINSRDENSPLAQSPSASISKLDLKAPGKARREYEKGFQLLMGKDPKGAIEHLGNATEIYPSFVAAHNALGSAYLALNQNEEARTEFDKAVVLDDHLPNSYLNLGCAELALKQYPEAEESLRKASSIAPLDLQLHTALAYGEYLNHDYPAVIETARQVHGRKHKSAAVVHYFAAAAWQAQDNLTEAQHQMEVLLQEDPKSSSAPDFRQLLDDIKAEQVSRAQAKLHPVQPVTFSFTSSGGPTSEEALRQAQQLLQDVKEKNQIAEAEAAATADSNCTGCATTVAVATPAASNSTILPKQPGARSTGLTLRAAVDEVAIFFTATDHGKSVTDLTQSDVEVRDDSKPPSGILSFRNEAELPLRLGLIIDTSNSITSRFSFEQATATKFLQKVVTNKDDLAFVIGVNNSVLMVQDFTSDQGQISRAINQLAPGGGTALWDAIAFAAEKLSSRPEIQPVARILVVISDGQDNSSSIPLKEAIAAAQHGEVAVYTVSTRDDFNEQQSALVGDHALQAISELTGGAAFVPGSLRRLNGSFTDLQQVIRGRYLVSYKPASFQRNGQYRSIDIAAKKDGRPLKVYARKGYYAEAGQSPGATP